MAIFRKAASIRTKLLLYFLPVIILSVLVTGILSYISASSQIERNTYSLLNDVINQTNSVINDRFDLMLTRITAMEHDQAIQRALMGSGELQDKLDYYSDVLKVNEQLSAAYAGNAQIIDSIYICTNRGKEYYRLLDHVPTRVGLNLKEWMEKYSGSSQGYYWMNAHPDDVFRTTEERRVLSLFRVFGSPDSELQAILLLNLKSEYFLSALKNVNVSENGYIALISPDGVLQSKPVPSAYALGDTGLKLLRESNGGKGSFNVVKADGTTLFVTFNSLKINQWTLAAIVPEKDIFAHTGQIRWITLFTVLTLILAATMLAMLFAGRLSDSLRYLSSQVRKVEKGDFNVSFQTGETNEIGVLANGLTSLVRTVDTLLNRVKEEQEKKRKFELMALQSQINPHFLYNTLGSIKFLSDMKDHTRASKMTSALTKFFMIGLSKGKEIITVAEEAEHAENYLMIQKMRYSRDFDYEFHLSEDIASCRIIKLTLQPVIENALYHGIKNRLEYGKILIRGWKEGDRVILEVFDDGAGMDGEMLQRLRASMDREEIDENPEGFGLRNVHQRIRLHFGPAFGLSVESRPGEYTCVRITIPWTM